MRWWALGLIALLAAAPVGAVAATVDGLVLRATAFVRGEADITPERIRCDAPGPDSSITDGTFTLGLFDTFGVVTRFFPDPLNPYANPCGGWLRVESALRAQGLVVEAVTLRYRLRNARTLRRAVVVRNGLPLACRGLRQARLAVGVRLGALETEEDAASAFIPLQPMVSPALVGCLQAVLRPVSIASLPLVITARVAGRTDGGQRVASNATGYTLTLLGNGGPLLGGAGSG